MKNVAIRGGSRVELDKVRETPSTVYVPEHLLGDWERLLKRRSKRKLLRLLLDGYEQALTSGHLPPSKKAKKLYQANGLNLEKSNFRPANADWAELAIHAHSIGYARNLLFIRLLEFELLRERLARKGIPTELPAYLARKAVKLVRLGYNELLEMKQSLLGRKFAHGP